MTDSPDTPDFSVFRFLDLPNELRNNIYAISLHHDRSNGITANTALLRTCRRVHKEARDLVYGENEFLVSACVEVHRHDLWATTHLSGDVPRTSIDNYKTMKFWQNWPPAIRRFKNINIDLKLQFDTPDTDNPPFDNSLLDYSPIEAFMWALKEFLKQGSEIQRLVVKLTIPIEPTWFQRIARYKFLFLIDLPKNVEIHFQGFKEADSLSRYFKEARIRHRASMVSFVGS